jgi:glucosamine-6-phosphate deaminase
VRAIENQSLVTFVADERSEAERSVAREIAELVRAKPSAVLGLAAGNTPIGVYAELARLHRAGELDLRCVVTFNLDEYIGLASGDPRTFRSRTRSDFLDRVNVAPDNVHFPDVDVSAEASSGACAKYEATIRGAGGIDLLLLGIGRNGHIAFNEPGSIRSSRTRVVELAPETRADAATVFGSPSEVPERAMTMGVATILEAKRIRVLALGESKAAVVARTLSEPIGSTLPATYLREHADATLHVDRAAASRIGMRSGSKERSDA